MSQSSSFNARMGGSGSGSPSQHAKPNNDGSPSPNKKQRPDDLGISEYKGDPSRLHSECMPGILVSQFPPAHRPATVPILGLLLLSGHYGGIRLYFRNALLIHFRNLYSISLSLL